MRLSVDELNGKTFTVTLDGVDVSNKTFNADEEGGFVDCHVLTDKGMAQLNAAKGDILSERLFGEVIIKEDEAMTEEEAEKAVKADERRTKEYFEKVGAKK